MRNKSSFYRQMNRTKIPGFQLQEETGLVKAVQMERKRMSLHSFISNSMHLRIALD